MLQQLRAALFGGDQAVRYECRNCGTMLDADRKRCSECYSVEIARYEL
jgi:uncharacterized OB-fold protein